ncbi:hypothetical protein ACEPPN_010393 [Leptodophora sp. 'Broadleaf-Isolate-01']
MVCTHVNKQREEYEKAAEETDTTEEEEEKPRGRPKLSPSGTQKATRRRSKSPQEVKKLRPEVYRVRDEETNISFPTQPAPNKPTEMKKEPRMSCKMITVSQYRRINNPFDRVVNKQEVVNVLAEIGCDFATFQNLDYLFIAADDSSHTELVGVAPKQRFIFAIDTIPRHDKDTPKSFNKYPLLGVIAIMEYLIPDIVVAKYNQIPMPDSKFWPIFGQWSARSLTKDKSPNGPQQCDGYNCGAFTITNVFCLAFGYRILCYAQNQGQEDLERWKKPRVIFELRQGGFFGDYEYDLLDIEPVKVDVPSYGPLVEDSDEDSQEGLLVVDMDPSVRTQGTFVINTTSEDDGNVVDDDIDVDDEDDSNMAYKIPDHANDHKYFDPPEEHEGYDTDQGSESSDGGGDSADPDNPGASSEIDESRRFYTATEALMHENPRVEPQEDTLQYPSQIGPRFQRAGFFYPIPAVNYQPGLNYSKKELKKACRDFPLVGWKRHSKDNKESFLKWMLNEMGAMMSLIHNDPIKPMYGLARAYPAWKRQHDFAAAERNRLDAEAILSEAILAETYVESPTDKGPGE